MGLCSHRGYERQRGTFRPLNKLALTIEPLHGLSHLNGYTYIDGTKLECVQNVKHLGMWFTPDMDNSRELFERKGNFIG